MLLPSLLKFLPYAISSSSSRASVSVFGPLAGAIMEGKRKKQKLKQLCVCLAVDTEVPGLVRGCSSHDER